MLGRWSFPFRVSAFGRPRPTTSQWPLAAATLALILAAGSLLAQTGPVVPSEAKAYAGQVKTVCGKVASVNYAVRTRGQPTFLNLDQPYPNQVFTVLIWGSDRPKFGTPEVNYRDKDICVTGQISVYQGVAEIVAKEPKQVSLAKAR